METQLILGDCLDKLKELKDNSVDSIVTDPPYGLSFMGKKWDYDVPSTDIWEECIRVLKPGGHLLSFAGSRTYHRMAVRIEDAGFEIRDQIMWIYGSGFPKSHNIGKSIDKLQGNEREVVGKNVSIQFKEKGIEPKKDYSESDGMFGIRGHNIDVTKGTSPYEGWGTALKPAHEPIVMARKPFKGTVADNVLEWGTGGINIDGCRIAHNEPIKVMKAQDVGNKVFGQGIGRHEETTELKAEGRFPANIIFDEEAGKILDEQSGKLNKQAKCKTDNKSGWQNEYVGGNEVNAVERKLYLDEGGASRFFYCPKTSKKDRNEGMPEEVPQFTARPRREDGSVIYKETDGEEWAEVMKDKPRREKTSLAGAEEKLQNLNKQPIGATYAGNQTTSKIGANPDKPTQPRANIHPTVKPTDLMGYLIRLVTPKGGVVLDPFTGSGSTGKAAVREGMNFIGIEREEEYIEIAKQRIQSEIDKIPNNKFWD